MHRPRKRGIPHPALFALNMETRMESYQMHGKFAVAILGDKTQSHCHRILLKQNTTIDR
jgi:hypothetical protein